MAIITEVRFAHEDGALAATLEALPELTVRIVRETSTTPSQDVYFFRFDNADADVVGPVLDDDHTVRKAAPVRAVDDQNLWGIEFAPETKLLAPEVTSNGGFVLDACSSRPNRTPRGWRERWFFPDCDGVQDIWKHARAEAFEFDVLDLARQLGPDVERVDRDPLTEQQRTALVTAYEQGYFKEPRETSLEELAETLDLSPSAVNGRLKRGLKALIGTTLVVEEPGADGPRPGDRDPAECRTRSGSMSVQHRVGERDE